MQLQRLQRAEKNHYDRASQTPAKDKPTRATKLDLTPRLAASQIHTTVSEPVTGLHHRFAPRFLTGALSSMTNIDTLMDSSVLSTNWSYSIGPDMGTQAHKMLLWNQLME